MTSPAGQVQRGPTGVWTQPLEQDLLLQRFVSHSVEKTIYGLTANVNAYKESKKYT